jgi:hypothetical protein
MASQYVDIPAGNNVALTESFSQDSNGNVIVVGAGTAGTPVGGVVSVQGETGMTPVITSGQGMAGTPAGGVTTVQGAAGMTPLSVTETSASTAVITSVASSITSVTLLAANPSRKGFILYNNSTKTANVAFAATASLISFTLIMPAMSYFEGQTLYTGAVSAIWATANGAMLVTDLT